MRIISNSFISGEISPDLFGRHDLKAYFQAAQSLENFEVRKTGGIRKRAGTQLLWDVNAGTDADFRVVPFFYDRTTYLAIVFYVRKNDNALYYRLCDPKDKSQSQEYIVPITQVSDGETLKRFKIKQIGDTLFFSKTGTRSFTGKVDYDKREIRWESFADTIPVKDAPVLNGKTNGKFDTNEEDGFRPDVRSYALFGVKDGVFSKPSTRDVTIYLYWVAGAAVELSFTPRWQDHDYYVLAQKVGASWGVMHSFYPDLDNGSQSDCTWSDNNRLASVDVAGVTYITDGVVTDLSKSANETKTEVDATWNTNAVVLNPDASYITGKFTPDESAPILGLRIWFGAKMRQENNPATVDNVGTSGKTTIRFVGLDTSDKETEIATWTTNAIYSENAINLTITDPIVGATGQRYRIYFENENNAPVVIRGIVLTSDSATQKYTDTNISAGEITGIQDRLTVGDAGMDCGVIDVWEQRLMMASSPTKPFTLWFSAAGDVKSFYASRPQTMADAFSVTIPVTVASRILHSQTSKWMILFTESGEYMVDSVGQQGFAFNTITIKRTSNVGAHDLVEPITTEDKVLFVASDAKSVYEIKYSLEQDNIIPVNRSMLVGHLTEGKQITKIVYKRFPEPVVYALLNDGSLLGLTYIPAQDVIAWHHHVFSGNLKCIDINATGTIHDGDEYETASEILLTFTDGSNSSRIWVERWRAPVATDTPSVEASVCADHMGYAEGNYPNEINPQSNVVAELITLRPESPQFNSMGQYKNIYDCCFRLNRSGTVKVRPFVDVAIDDATSVHQESATPDIVDGKVNLITKDIKVLPRAYHNSDGQMVVTSDDEFPCEILSVLFNVNVADVGE